jgi:hypothetical protein
MKSYLFKKYFIMMMHTYIYILHIYIHGVHVCVHTYMIHTCMCQCMYVYVCIYKYVLYTSTVPSTILPSTTKLSWAP